MAAWNLKMETRFKKKQAKQIRILNNQQKRLKLREERNRKARERNRLKKEAKAAAQPVGPVGPVESLESLESLEPLESLELERRRIIMDALVAKQVKREERNRKARERNRLKKEAKAAAGPVGFVESEELVEIIMDASHVKRKERNRKERERRSFQKYGPEGKPVDTSEPLTADAKRVALNKRRRDQRSFKLYGKAAKPLMDKAEKAKERLRKQQEIRRLHKEAKTAAKQVYPVGSKEAKLQALYKRRKEILDSKKAAVKEFTNNVYAPDM